MGGPRHRSDASSVDSHTATHVVVVVEVLEHGDLVAVPDHEPGVDLGEVRREHDVRVDVGMERLRVRREDQEVLQP